MMKSAIIMVVFTVILGMAWAGTFRDDFENEKDFNNDKQLREGGVWGEDIVQYTWENGCIKGNVFADNFFILKTGDYGLADYTIECRIKLITDLDNKDDYIGLVLRRPCIDCRPGYFFFIGNNIVSIIPQGGDMPPLKTVPFQTMRDVWYSLKAVAKGEQLEFYIDNKLLLEAKDNVYRSGKVGFVVQDRGGKIVEALFDDFVMTGPEVKDGGHWNPKAHSQIAVETKDKLSITWGKIKFE